MADSAIRNAVDGGDADLWSPFEQAANRLAIGALTRKLYIDGADVKLSAGMNGLDDGTWRYNVSNAAARVISLVGLTVSLWAKVEISVVAGVVVTTITSIVGANNPASLPASFTGSYDGTKGGYYETATKRIIGLLWINAAGACEGIVTPFAYIDGYEGYATSDDAVDTLYRFTKSIQTPDASRWIRKTAAANYICPDIPSYYDGLVIEVGGIAAAGETGITVTLPTASANAGKQIVVLNTGNAPIIIDGEGAEKINNYNGIYLLSKYNRAHLECIGTEWIIVAYRSSAASGMINRSDWTNVRPGFVDVDYDNLAGTFRVGEIVTETETGVTGIIMKVSGTNLICKQMTGTGYFTNNNHLTGGTSGATALVNEAALTKNLDCELYHGTGLSLREIAIRFFWSADGTDNAMQEIYASDHSASDRGFNTKQVDTNNVRLQLGAAGFNYIDTAGTIHVVAADDDYYCSQIEIII